ncbi:arabinosyltransferase domain-containing protein [Corynebacterium halotolerans]|uniref:Arabinosyltransferase n=1 Tax=Corynebacterium halotolerans YIM 70093 = DSM 44683 TaxID=1121362 RepID=M1NIL4_9CORY|nr:arabinosyltransferase domain-containing protein [Corynebacterium halotolerans]AGF71268.1 arabinosyltransferase [Corynebacterium halotolerans YIM 70093 = DSM 44683]
MTENQKLKKTATPLGTAPAWLKNLAIVSGVLGFLLFVVTPFLPVNQTQSSFSWPQDDSLNSVNAPLVSYAPEELHATVPVDEAIDGLRGDQTLLLSTLPADSTDATSRGLFVRSSDGGIDVVVRDQVPLELTAEEVEALPDDAVLEVSSTEDGTTATIPDATDEDGEPYEGSIDEDVRPQVTGVYTEIDDTAGNLASLTDAGLSVDVEINSRFTSTPSVWKSIAMWGGLALLLVALWTLHRMDRLDGRSTRRFLPQGWWRLRPLDGIVSFVLVFWHIFGANTSDDGFILTMARVSENAGYMANYYRWFGVPESPFGSPYYDLLALMVQVSTASVWVRLPALISGLVIWFVLSREILPRLGAKIAGRQVAHWTAAFVFLAFWLPYNNGTRPEPVIAMGAILTWASFERSIATSRLLPAAVGVIIATLSLGAGPTGLMAVAALLASLSSLIRIVYRRLPYLGAGEGSSKGRITHAVVAMVAPFLAAGTAILIGVFGDQTWATVMESIRVRAAKGPALDWYDEWVRYQTLMEQTVDGSLTRRFAVLMMFLCLAVVIASILRNGRVPGAAKGPSLRLVLIIFGTMFFMMFTPTKWTHHFGVYAGIAGALAALAAVALSYMALRSSRTRTLFIGAVLFILAISLAGINGWWYVSSFGIPWFDKTVQYQGVEASTIVLFIALAVLLIGVIQSFIGDVRSARAEALGELDEYREERKQRLRRFTGVAAAPIAVSCVLIVGFSMASFTKAFIDQYPAYTVGLGNLRALGGQTCGLANDALVETNSNDSFLTPAGDVGLGESLESEDNRGFEANNLPPSITQDVVSTSSVGAIADTDNAGGSEEATGQETGNTGGVRGDVGVNGSRARLPFNLDYTEVPVVGSWTSGPQYPAEITTAWYELPAEQREDAPLLVVSAAGRIEHHDINGVLHEGQELVLEYGTRGPDGEVDPESVGELEMLDIGPQPSWRNLRLPLDALPEEADVVRVSATDHSLDPEQWLAFTPPRVPTLDSLDNVVGSEKPGLLDWSVALQFPCQRTFDHYAGVAEIPEYRISPDHPGKATLTPFQDYEGGGVMGTAEAVNWSFELPSYTKDDWHRDWGSIEIYLRRANSEGQAPDNAEIDTETIQRSGLWHPSDMKIDG